MLAKEHRYGKDIMDPSVRYMDLYAGLCMLGCVVEGHVCVCV